MIKTKYIEAYVGKREVHAIITVDDSMPIFDMQLQGDLVEKTGGVCRSGCLVGMESIAMKRI